MKRKLNKGIFFYPMEADHTSNKRLRLLFNDHDSDGYWIWSNLISYAYRMHGYYFSANIEDIELMSADCRKSPELIQEVIKSCVKRGLFVKEIFDKFNVLTNDRMQINYLRATYENRRKGYTIYLEEKYYAIGHSDLIELSEVSLKNVIFRNSGKLLSFLLSENQVRPELFNSSTELFNSSTEKSTNSTEKVDFSEHKGKERKGKEKYLASSDAPEEFLGGQNGSLKIDKSEMLEGVKKIGPKKQKKTPQKTKDLATKIFNDIKIIWWEWYMARNNKTAPKFDGGSGTAIQNLAKYFITRAKAKKFETEEEIYHSSIKYFKYILENWELLKQNKFLYSSVDIKKINSNINDIVNFLHHGKSAPANNTVGKTIEFD